MRVELEERSERWQGRVRFWMIRQITGRRHVSLICNLDREWIHEDRACIHASHLNNPLKSQRQKWPSVAHDAVELALKEIPLRPLRHQSGIFEFSVVSSAESRLETLEGPPKSIDALIMRGRTTVPPLNRKTYVYVSVCTGMTKKNKLIKGEEDGRGAGEEGRRVFPGARGVGVERRGGKSTLLFIRVVLYDTNK